MLKQEDGSEEKDKIYDRVLNWYSQLPVHYLISSKCFNREFAIMSQDGMMRRSLRVHNAQNFQYIFRCWHIMDRLWNDRGLEKFYYSCAVYHGGVPYQNPDLSINAITHAWNDQCMNHMTGYDLFIDIDEHMHNNFRASKESMILVHEYLKKICLPHEINFSGRGFHVIVPYRFLPMKSFNPEASDNIYLHCLKIVEHINKKITELADLSVFEPRRLIKCPYSLALYDKDLYVCTPLTMEKDIYDCRLNDFIPENVNIKNGFDLFK